MDIGAGSSVDPNLWRSGVGRTYDEASEVGSEDGEVTVSGPDVVAVSLAPEAAAETGDRLIGAAAEAHDQNLRTAMRKRDRPQPD
jgi:hypothetical protein